MAKTPTSTDVLVGSRVCFRRTEIGLTQQVLAEKLGVTFQQVQKYEKGTNRIGAGRLQEVSKALGVPITYFFQSLSGEEVAGEDQGSAAKIMRVSGASDLLRAYHRSRAPQFAAPSSIWCASLPALKTAWRRLRRPPSSAAKRGRVIAS